MSVLSTITSLLPPPTYLRMPALGVDVSDTSLKYINFKPDLTSGRKLHVDVWGDVVIPNNALHRGMVEDVPALGKVLQEVKERTSCDTVRLSLPEERAYIFETEIKKSTPAKEIRGQLEFRLEENVPLSPRDALFDYELVPHETESDSMRVLVTVYAKETIMNYFEACQMAGFTPLSFEVEAQAIARATISKHDPRTHMIVDFGKTRSGIGIVKQGGLLYTSTIDIGGLELSRSMRDSLGDVAEKELTTMKNEIGLLGSTVQSEVRASLLPIVQNIANEITVRLNYWNNRIMNTDARHVHSVILCGGSANMRGLPEFLTHELGIETVRANVWQNVEMPHNHVPVIHRRYSYGYSTAIGLALTSYI